MSSPHLNSVICTHPTGLHRMAYWEWGEATNPNVVLCVHGLTRTGRDFDRLAQALAKNYRVICPDIVGRGRSDWFNDPAFYNFAQYIADIVTLLARLQAQSLMYVGTSMGGLIGMLLIGAVSLARQQQAQHRPMQLPKLPEIDISINKCVLNDIGPRLESGAITRIQQHVGQANVFDTFEQAVKHVQSASKSFGPHSEEQWQELTRYVYVPHNGQWIKHYDLGIAVPFNEQTNLVAAEQLLWESFKSISCPTLIVRGQESDLLSVQTAQEMLKLNANAHLYSVPGVGHAPMLMQEDQIIRIVNFLQSSE